MPAASPESRFLRNSLPPPTPLPDPIFSASEPGEADSTSGGYNWSLSSKYQSRKVNPPRVAFATPETNAERSFAANQLVQPNMSSPRMSSPHMTSQRMSPNISSPRIVANLTDVSAKLSTTIGEGLCSAVAGKGACFIVYGTDTEGRPVLSVGYLASVLVVSLIGPAQVDSQRFESLTDGSVRVWYTAKVSGRYSLRVGVRSPRSTVVEALPGSPFIVEVAARRESLRGERRRSGAGVGASELEDAPIATSTTGHGDGIPHDPRPLLRSLRSTVGSSSAVRSSDVRLRAPRGHLAHAVAGERARIELIAPTLGGGRVELPGRMNCVLHLQSPWCEADHVPTQVAHTSTEADVASANPAAPIQQQQQQKHQQKQQQKQQRVIFDDDTPAPLSRERYFRGRIAFAPSSAQPGYSSESPDVRNAQFGAPPDTRPVFANVAEEQSSIDLRFGGAVEAGGAGAGTLLYATFCVPRAGTYLAHITLDQQHVVGSPLVLRVAPCAACAHRSEVRGAAQTQALAGRHEICTVWLRDAFGNARRAMDAPAAGPLTATLELLSAPETTPETPGQFADEYYGAHDGDGWAAHADSWAGGGLGKGSSNTCSSARLRVGSGQRAGSTLAAAASAAVTLKPDGSFAVGYTIRRAGIWALSLMLGDEPIGRSPYAVSCWPAALHPPTCDVAGQLHEAVAGVPNLVEVRARDRFGNRLRSGGAGLLLTALLMDVEDAPPTHGVASGSFVDHEDGRYSGSIVVYHAGQHALSITSADGAPLYGSPFLLTVSPAPPQVERCVLLQSGARGLLLRSPETTPNGARASSAMETPVTTPPLQPTAASAAAWTSASASSAAWAAAALADGSAVSPHSPHSPHASSRARDRRRLHEEESRRLPSAVPAEPSIALRAGEETTLGLRVADAFGNTTVFEPSHLEVSIESVNGDRTGALLAPEAEYSVRALTEDGAAREGAAATTREGGTGTGAESPRRSSTLSSARHVSASKAAATSPSKAWTSLRASSAAPSHPGGAASGGAAGGGVLIVRLFRAGDHLVRARLGALELPGSPVRLRVEPAKVSAKHCYIAHDAASALRAGHTPLDPNFGLSGVLRVSALTLLTADKYANPVRHGGAGVTAKLSGPGACSTTVEDHLDGSYTISWSAVLSGVYRVSVLVDGAHCAGSPFAVQVDPAAPGSPTMPPPGAPSTQSVAWSPRSTAAARSYHHLEASTPADEERPTPVGRPLTVTSFASTALSTPAPAPSPRGSARPWR